jgi:hypothetical protein
MDYQTVHLTVSGIQYDYYMVDYYPVSSKAVPGTSLIPPIEELVLLKGSGDFMPWGNQGAIICIL